MKVLGISGSPRKNGTTVGLVREILNATGGETEFLSLAGKDIRPCRYCLTCAKDNVCRIRDDMAEIRSKILDADALVIGGCNMWSTLNGQTHNLLERFFQFHHHGRNRIAGKSGVAVGVGGGDGHPPAEMISNFFANLGIRSLGAVTAQGAFACYTCGFGNTCNVITVQGFLDENGHIDMRFKPDLSKQPKVLDEARKMGKMIVENFEQSN